MKVKPLLKQIDTKNFLQQYLSACGVEDVDGYLQADLGVCDDPWLYPHMEEGVDRLKKAIDSGEKIGVLVDKDNDGYTSATLIYRFIKKVAPNHLIVPLYHVWKSHGIVQSKDEDVVASCVENDIKLLICPDSASNDTAQCKQLKELGVDCLITDHHEIECDNPYAIVINHHLGEGLNTALSGCGVTFKLVQACADTWGIDLGDEYYDLVASSIVSDSCDTRTLENYALIKYGFTHMTNPMLIALFEEFNKKAKNPHGIAFGSIPKINAIARWSNLEAEDIVFRAFVGEVSINKAVELAKEAHSYQNEVVRQFVKEIEPNLDHSHSVLIGYGKAEYRNYSGLVANKLTGTYGKPSLILRDGPNNTWTGSLRSPIELANHINESGLANCQGHLKASGCWFPKANLDSLIEWFDRLGLTTETIKPVTAVLTPKQVNLPLCHACGDNMLLWGSESTGVPLPKFYMRFETSPSMIRVFVKNGKKTVKATIGQTSIMKFMAKQEDVDLLQNKKCQIECIVTLDVNEWNGVESPQAKIETWEIKEIEDKEESWEDWF